jgi:hypothetical protein
MLTRTRKHRRKIGDNPVRVAMTLEPKYEAINYEAINFQAIEFSQIRSNKIPVTLMVNPCHTGNANVSKGERNFSIATRALTENHLRDAREKS